MNQGLSLSELLEICQEESKTLNLEDRPILIPFNGHYYSVKNFTLIQDKGKKYLKLETKYSGMGY